MLEIIVAAVIIFQLSLFGWYAHATGKLPTDRNRQPASSVRTVDYDDPEKLRRLALDLDQLAQDEDTAEITHLYTESDSHRRLESQWYEEWASSEFHGNFADFHKQKLAAHVLPVWNEFAPALQSVLHDERLQKQCAWFELWHTAGAEGTFEDYLRLKLAGEYEPRPELVAS